MQLPCVQDNLWFADLTLIHLQALTILKELPFSTGKTTLLELMQQEMLHYQLKLAQDLLEKL